MRKMFAGVLALALPLVVFAESEMKVDGVAAYVGSYSITISDVIRSSADLQQQLRRNTRDITALNSIYTNALERLIEDKLILSDYDNQDKLKIPENAFVERENAMVEQMFNGNRSDFLDQLAAEGITEDQWRNNLRSKSIVSAMINLNVESKIAISPLAAYEEYKSSADKYTAQPSVKMRMIVVSKGSGDAAEKEQKKKMVKVLSELKDGGDFAELAKKYSEDSYAEKGGERGWTKKDMLRKELADAAFGAEPGAVRVVDLGKQYCVIQIEDIVKAEKIPFEEARPLIERELRHRQSETLYNAWIKRLRRDIYVKIVGKTPF